MEKILTDEEIMLAFEYCTKPHNNPCSNCICFNKHTCLRYEYKAIFDLLNRQKAEMERLQAERDMAVKDLHANTKCHICQHLPDDGNMTHCPHYASCGLAYIHFKWRGATEERES